MATHPEMLLGHIVEDAATGIWMERPHPTEGMLEADSSWAPGHAGERMAIDSLDSLDWLDSYDSFDRANPNMTKNGTFIPIRIWRLYGHKPGPPGAVAKKNPVAHAIAI